MAADTSYSPGSLGATGMRQPLIALSGRRWKSKLIDGMPDNFDDLGIDLHVGAYADAVAAAGGIPVSLPCLPSAVGALDYAHGLVLSGGADVSPSRYGCAPHPSVYGVDDRRDDVEFALAERALDIGLPILAICRGMQVLNVVLGGSLVQHLDPSSGNNHAAWDDAPHALTHHVRFRDGSLAAATYGSTSAGVNSLHHQALSRIGEGLVVSGWASDGTVEAAEMPGRPVLAVQWHPELVEAQPDPAFTWLVNTAVAIASTPRQ